MTTTTYEERLWLFAQGKRLRRFRGLLRAPRDTYCDACGSSLPSHLFGLRDMDGKHDYFVGANCMSRLSQMLVLERPFVRADIVAAYERADHSEPDRANAAGSHAAHRGDGRRRG